MTARACSAVDGSSELVFPSTNAIASFLAHCCSCRSCYRWGGTPRRIFFNFLLLLDAKYAHLVEHLGDLGVNLLRLVDEESPSLAQVGDGPPPP